VYGFGAAWHAYKAPLAGDVGGVEIHTVK